MSLWDKGDGGALIVRDGLLERSVWGRGEVRSLVGFTPDACWLEVQTLEIG